MEKWKIFRKRISDLGLWHEIPSFKIITGKEFVEMFQGKLEETDRRQFANEVAYIFRDLDAVGVWLVGEECHLVTPKTAITI